MIEHRRICVFTGTRADYGLLYWLMRDLKADPAIRLQVLATGTHMSPAFGMTREAIEADGFQIDEFIEILIDADTPTATATAMGLGLMKFGDAFSRLRPHLLIILGDRFEALAAAAAAVALRIPIAHIHGGEATEGQIDEQIRHAITKLSHLHFTAAAPYRRRVLQMGEFPEHVFDVGALGVDNLTRLRLLDRAELEARLDVELGSLSFLVTYHPVTLRDESPERSLVALFDALDRFPEACVFFTKSNADMGGRMVNQLIDQWAAARPGRVRAVTSLGTTLYLSAMRAVTVVIGNSSSGIIEAPAAGTPTVNMGDRQKGRLRAPSVIDCPEDAASIEQAIRLAISPAFLDLASRAQTPYGCGGASAKIRDVLKTVPLEGLLIKCFHSPGSDDGAGR